MTGRASDAATVVNYDGPDESVECAYPGCTNRLRRSDFNAPQFCSKAHRDGSAAHPFEPGQVWRSLALRDYRVRLIRRFENDAVWFVEPMGSSAHGNYTQREDVLSNPNLYVLEADPDA